MLDVGRCHNFDFLPVASNDNDDLLAFSAPSLELSLVRELKRDMREHNAQTGSLLSSRKDRRFFQEVIDAERYLMLRYFSSNPSEATLRRLKRHILDTYLFPRARQRGK